MKYKFWVKSSRQTDLSSVVDIDNSYETRPDILKQFLEDWCEDVFPMFRFTDGFVTYGYEKIEENK